MDGARPISPGQHVSVVQEREQHLSSFQLFFDGRQCVVDCTIEQQRHQRIALFSAFVLFNVMAVPFIILPFVRVGSVYAARTNGNKG